MLLKDYILIKDIQLSPSIFEVLKADFEILNVAGLDTETNINELLDWPLEKVIIEVFGETSFEASAAVELWKNKLNPRKLKPPVGGILEAPSKSEYIESRPEEKTIQALIKANSKTVLFGAGKTTLVSVLAKNYVIVNVTFQDIIIDTTYQGQLEKKLQLTFDFIESIPNSILFIDDLETFINKQVLESVLNSIIARKKMSVIVSCKDPKIIEVNESIGNDFVHFKLSELDKQIQLKSIYKKHSLTINFDHFVQFFDICLHFSETNERGFKLLQDSLKLAKQLHGVVDFQHLLESLAILSNKSITEIFDLI